MDILKAARETGLKPSTIYMLMITDKISKYEKDFSSTKSETVKRFAHYKINKYNKMLNFITND